MREILNAARREALQAMNGRAVTKLADIISYDPNNFSVRVLLQPEGVQTGWIPLATPWVGNGWGMFAAPSIGDMVAIEFQEGDPNAGIACARLYNDQNRPLAVDSGEFWLVHQSGAFVKLLNNGKLTLNGSVEVDATAPTVNIVASVSVNVTAPSITLGALGQSLKSFITDTFIGLFNGHTHPGDSGGTTGAPNQQMSEATHATTTVKGG